MHLCEGKGNQQRYLRSGYQLPLIPHQDSPENDDSGEWEKVSKICIEESLILRKSTFTIGEKEYHPLHPHLLKRTFRKLQENGKVRKNLEV